MKQLKLGSLFDGSGTAPLAAAMCGIQPVWASEIEAFPISVTSKRFPRMKHLGSITEINGAEIEPVDVICGGSPCQDLSVAGKQAGLHEGKRSHLFFEMTRIIKEMRGATNGKYPRYVIWENVPGAFASNGGNDFLAVLRAFAEIADPDVHVPRPESKRNTDRLAWKYAGTIVGDGYSIAWRTVDAQYWGVPQRRRRIYLVADFGSERAGEILFERTGVQGNPEPRGAAREETAGDAGGGFEGSCGVKCLNPWGSQTIRQYDTDGLYPALTSNATGGQNRQGIVYPTVARCLTAEHDASPCVDRGQNVVAAFMGGQGAKALSIAYCDDGTTPHLRAENSGSNQVPDIVYALQGNGGDVGPESECFVWDARGNGTGGVSPTLTGDHQNRVTDYTAICVGNGQLHNISMAEQMNTLDCMHDQQAVLTFGNPPRKYIVRRLTPLECCRLQGFPDWWIDGCEEYPVQGWWTKNDEWRRWIDPSGAVAGSDSAKYKMWGNGMALPNMLFVMAGIAAQEDT